jgi:hypothetical protein
VLLLTLADAGLRPGEACALRWTDFDPVVSTLLIERTADNKGRVKTTKTAETRLVNVSARLAAALTHLQASLEADAMLAGREGISPWVFRTRTGTPVWPNRVAKIFERVLRAAGLPHFRLYDLRHTYASHLIAARAPIDYVAKQLGHSKLTTTPLYYAHWFPKGDRRHIEEMERIRAAAKPLASRVPPDEAGLRLDAEVMNEDSWHHFGTTTENQRDDDAEVVDKTGSPGWTRTSDILINSQALYRLSYRGTRQGFSLACDERAE